MSKLTPGMAWQRETFTRSPWTEQQLISMIDSQELPGEVIAGKPFIYANKALTWRGPVQADSIPNLLANDA